MQVYKDNSWVVEEDAHDGADLNEAAQQTEHEDDQSEDVVDDQVERGTVAGVDGCVTTKDGLTQGDQHVHAFSPFSFGCRCITTTTTTAIGAQIFQTAGIPLSNDILHFLPALTSLCGQYSAEILFPSFIPCPVTYSAVSFSRGSSSSCVAGVAHLWKPKKYKGKLVEYWNELEW